jgi:hypothetical protein
MILNENNAIVVLNLFNLREGEIMQYAIELSQQQAVILQQRAIQAHLKVEDLLQLFITQILTDNEIKKPQPEQFVSDLQNMSNDPLEKFIGIAYSENPDWIDKHDTYIGQVISVK